MNTSKTFFLDLKKIKTLLVFFALISSSCSFHLDASLEEISKNIPSVHLNDGLPREISEGETVVTPNGIVVKGAFGQIVEKKILSNGVIFEGAVYE